MERVQFQQEQMLQELQDLVEKNIFTEKETRQIMKKRTAFETALVRRVAKKSDYLRYITYEMGLEQLRRKRVARLKIPTSPPTISDYALVRRQFQIFERALKKFKSDVGLWLQYIQLAKREGARALVGRITARALQLHPNKPALYILAASHELDHLSPSAARTLLQRGIRMNPESIDMWREYVRVELGFVESVRRRWGVLGISEERMGASTGGISMKLAGKGKGREKEDPSDEIMQDLEDIAVNDDIEGVVGGGSLGAKSEHMMQVDEEPDSNGMRGDGDKEQKDEKKGRVEEWDGDRDNGGDSSVVARRRIMQGEIVKSVMTNAAKALPKIGLFEQLRAIIAEHPSPTELRSALLEHLYELVRDTLSPGDPGAARFLADRHLTGLGSAFANLDTNGNGGKSLVDGIQRANEELVAFVRRRWGNARADVGGQLADEDKKDRRSDDARDKVASTTVVAAGRVGIVTDSDRQEEDVCRVYADFVEEWCQRRIDEHLRLYLMSSLQSVIHEQLQQHNGGASRGMSLPSAPLLAAHIRLMIRRPAEKETSEVPAAKILRRVRKYTEKLPGSSCVWVARLDAERMFGEEGSENVLRVWKEAREKVRGGAKGALELWTWGLDSDKLALGEKKKRVHEELLRDSMRDGSLQAIHETVLKSYVVVLDKEIKEKAKAPDQRSPLSALWLKEVQRIGRTYFPTAKVWRKVFELVSGCVGLEVGDEWKEDVLRVVYEEWRGKDGVEAAAEWGRWLVEHGKGREACDMVTRTQKTVGGDEGMELEKRWRRILDGEY